MSQSNSIRRYEEIAKKLLQEIRLGEYRVGGRLPSERVLVERFGVQRNTIRRALKSLEDAGQIVIEEKRGAFVRPAQDSPERKTLLLSLHSGPSPELAGLYDGFSRTASRAGYGVRLYDTNPATGAALDPVPRPEELDADISGVAIWPQNPTDEYAISKLNGALPLVLVDRRVHGVVADCVRFDDVAGGRMVTEHLIAQGHRRIAFLADEVFAETVQHRWQGYAAAHEAHALPLDATLCLFFRAIYDPVFADFIRAVLSRGDRAPTAIVCANDVVAFALLRLLRDDGVAVPSRVAVTGYGNLVPDLTTAMELTSVTQPFTKMGETAAGLLLERIAEWPASSNCRRYDIKIPVTLADHPSSTLTRDDEKRG